MYYYCHHHHHHHHHQFVPGAGVSHMKPHSKSYRVSNKLLLTLKLVPLM